MLPGKYTDVTVRRFTYEPCLYELRYKGEITYMSVHTDDCDCATSCAAHAKFFTDACNELFGTKDGKGEGIKLVDPRHMLGLVRELSCTGDGVRTLHIHQAAYLEDMWRTFGKYRKSKRAPQHPYPIAGDAVTPILDEEGKPIDVSDEEAARVLNLGYRT